MKKQSKKFMLAGVVLLAIAGLLALTSCKNDSVPEQGTSVPEQGTSVQEETWLQERKKELEGKTEGTYTIIAPSYLTKGGLVDLAKLLRDLPYGVWVDLDLSQATGLTYIAAGTFIDCLTLQSVELPSSVTEIGSYAFAYTGLTEVTIPEGVTTIGDSAFQHCYGLTGVTIPAGVTTIGASAFFSCSSLAEVTIPAGVTTIEVSAFDGCEKLSEVTIPASVTTIRGSAFQGCTSLTKVTIPASVTEIGPYAFAGTGLTSVTIPEDVTTIGDYAFYNCANLNQVIFQKTEGWYMENLYDEAELPESINVGDPSANAEKLREGDWAYMNLIRIES